MVAEKTKDTVVDTTKDVAEKTKKRCCRKNKGYSGFITKRTSTISNDKEYEEGVAGTNTKQGK